jgi:hypothetical protein
VGGGDGGRRKTKCMGWAAENRLEVAQPNSHILGLACFASFLLSVPPKSNRPKIFFLLSTLLLPLAASSSTLERERERERLFSRLGKDGVGGSHHRTSRLQASLASAPAPPTNAPLRLRPRLAASPATAPPAPASSSPSSPKGTHSPSTSRPSGP